MPKALHILRTRRFRLLASLLVMLAILCNGIGLAQAHAHSMSAEKDCCVEMMAKKMSPDKPCSMPKDSCDDQCMARCMSANGVLFSVSLTFYPNILIAVFSPRTEATERSLAKLGPGLRPPILA